MKFQIRVLEEAESTNTLAREEAKAGAPEGTVIIALRQTGGRGRSGRSFYSPGGTGLYLSMILRPERRAEESLRITTLCAVAAAEACDAFRKTWLRSVDPKADIMEPGEPCGIKWVNDLMLRNRKIAGILAEAGFSGKETPEFVVLGIGINLAEPKEGFPPELADIAGALLSREEAARIPGFYEDSENNNDLPAQESSGSAVRDQSIPAAGIDAVLELAKAFLTAFAKGYRELIQRGSRQYMEEYRRRSVLIGKKVRLLDTDHQPIPEEPAVTVAGIGDEGELQLVYPDGHSRSVSWGEVSVRAEKDTPGIS